MGKEKDFKPQDMVHWFRPYVLIDAARRAIISMLFADYADRRLMQAALDTVEAKTLFERCTPKRKGKMDVVTEIVPNSNGEVWIDYVADLGDGFDSTYSVALMLAGKTLKVAGADKPLPRGQALIMGGDEVYPIPNREEYRNRLQIPYKYAFPDSKAEDAVHPPVLMIPGNHDWYDGLTLFLALFCRGRETSLGSWRAIQHRSYFALQLPFNWWIWGIDTQLLEDIDQPQANYFVDIARQMPENAKIILCGSVPSWIKAEMSSKHPEKRSEFYRSLDYAANVVKNDCKNARIYAVLSGDLHHYSRYSSELNGTQFITAGGGGAFLHPTHHLKDKITMTFMREKHVLSLKTEPGGEHKPTDKEACYPSRAESRSLAWGNFKFAWKNWDFSLTLGCFYAVFAHFLLFTQESILQRFSTAGVRGFWEIFTSTLCSPAAGILFPLVLFVFFKYSEGENKWHKGVAAFTHGMAHYALMVALASSVAPLNAWIGSVLPFGGVNMAWEPNALVLFLLSTAEIVLFGGFFGGFIWGVYLVYVSHRFAFHPNDAFSAMRLNKYRNFLRMRIKEDELVIYSIGLDQPPMGGEWQDNPAAMDGDQDQPVIIAKSSLMPKLIEDPIVIRAKR